VKSDLYYALIALDAYNQGPPKSNRKLEVFGDRLGFYNIERGETDSDFQEGTGFFAQKYTYGGKTVIGYRGTDFDQTPDFLKDVLFGWSISTGNFSAFSQVPEAIAFYQSVTGKAGLYDGVASDVVLTGHSLGGGLAAFVSAASGTKAYAFDHMPIGYVSVL
jgi:hypothetical protein